MMDRMKSQDTPETINTAFLVTLKLLVESFLVILLMTSLERERSLAAGEIPREFPEELGKKTLRLSLIGESLLLESILEGPAFSLS